MKHCLIGEKLSHSYSKEIHNACGLDYTLKEICRCGVGDFVLNSDFGGFNVTIPYKKDVLGFLDEISDDAKSIGAVNTVVIKNGKRYGYNTDVFGLLYTLERKDINLSGKTVMILGTGGASNAVKHVAEKLGASKIIIVGRNSDINYENCYNYSAHVLFNATPVGMFPMVDDAPIDLSKLKGVSAVIDLVYNPQKTKLLLQAEKLGLTYSNGIPMLVEQALSAQDLWLSKTHEATLSESLILKITKEKLNICLTGMPASGKSTIGKMLAKKLNREFIDLDEEIVKFSGKTPAELITTQGEAEFRKIETEVLKAVAFKSGVVISLGGGAIISEENREMISKNSVTVYVKRDLSLLTTGGRPLSIAKGVETLYNERKAYYETADITVENNGDIETAVKEILKEYETACNQWSKP
ncbi:MAG: hypothetical protein J6V66_01950 [Clostridia bacterium]|nr:hypothetical protein [Clostridia bacterium]